MSTFVFDFKMEESENNGPIAIVWSMPDWDNSEKATDNLWIKVAREYPDGCAATAPFRKLPAGGVA